MIWGVVTCGMYVYQSWTKGGAPYTPVDDEGLNRVGPIPEIREAYGQNMASGTTWEIGGSYPYILAAAVNCGPCPFDSCDEPGAGGSPPRNFSTPNNFLLENIFSSHSM